MKKRPRFTSRKDYAHALGLLSYYDAAPTNINGQTGPTKTLSGDNTCTLEAQLDPQSMYLCARTTLQKNISPSRSCIFMYRMNAE